MIVGVDEAGRGPLAGCVVACALYIKNKIDLPIRDSKSLSLFKREFFFEQFRDKVDFSVGIATHQEIDKYNILKATFFAFERAIGSLIKSNPYLKPSTFIIDGNNFDTTLPITYHCIVKADKTVKEVALASIVAKLFRDYLMSVAHFCFPEWNFRKHKGYPTVEHFGYIRKYSFSPLHRKTFIRCPSEKKVTITS